VENSLLDEKYLNIKIDFKNCILLNSSSQFTICNEKKEPLKKEYQYISISNRFKIAISKKDIKKLEKEFPNINYLISPFLILYFLFLKDKNEKALWILNQKDFITIAIFKDESIIFSKHHEKGENFKFDRFIIDSISEFYEGECCYFIEEIFLFDADELKDVEVKKLYESLLIEIRYKQIDLKKILKEICKDEELLNYTVRFEKEKYLFPKWLKIVAIFIFLLLAVFDIYIRYQNSKSEKRIVDLQREKESIQKNIENLQDTVLNLKKILPVVQEIKSSNSLVKTNIKNIFDLVPDPIVLSKAEFTKTSLILEGFTPSKKDFEKFINRALKNFYQKTKVKYKRVKNGYYFISINQEALKVKNEH